MTPLKFPRTGPYTEASTGAIIAPSPVAGGPWIGTGWPTGFWSSTAAGESPTRGSGGHRTRYLKKSGPLKGSTGFWRESGLWALPTRPSGMPPPARVSPIRRPGIRCFSPRGTTSGFRAGCSCTTGCGSTTRDCRGCMCSAIAGTLSGPCPCFNTTAPIPRIWTPRERTTRRTRHGTSAWPGLSGQGRCRSPGRRAARSCFWTLRKNGRSAEGREWRF